MHFVHGNEIRCDSQLSNWCVIAEAVNITDGEEIAIANSDHKEKVTHFTWRTASNVKHIPNVIFETFPNLEICDLAIGLEEIEPADFNCAENIVTFALLKNRIRLLPTGVFVRAAKLDTLQLEYNRIERIEDYALKGLDRLLTISLNSNYVTIIGRYTFAGSPNLQQIDLSNNDVYNIEQGAFDLPRLKSVSLGGNHLKTLPNGLFDQAPLLATFDINDNNFHTVPEAFFGDNAIDNLDMSWNPLDEVRLKDWAKMPKLQTLLLHQTGIVWPSFTDQWEIPSESTATEIDLSYNKVANPDILKLLSVFGKLEKLHLNGCRITTINNIIDIKEHFPNITELHVEYNEMDCDWVKTAADFLNRVDVNLAAGDDEDDVNVSKRERVDERPCGRYFDKGP